MMNMLQIFLLKTMGKKATHLGGHAMLKEV